MTDEGLISFKWNNHNSTFFNVFSRLRSKETYSDVTLACDGKFFPVHKLVMSTCSDYFSEVFENTACKCPVIILKDIGQSNLEALLDYMYLGEAEVKQSDLNELLKAAECLKIKGLAVPDDDYPLHHSTPPKNCNEGDSSLFPAPKRLKKEIKDEQSSDRPLEVSVSQSCTSSTDTLSSLPSPSENISTSSMPVALPDSNESPKSPERSDKKKSYSKKKIKVQTPNKTKLARPIKIIKHTTRRAKRDAALVNKALNASVNSHNHRTYFFKHEEASESIQNGESPSTSVIAATDIKQEVAPEDNSEGVSMKVDSNEQEEAGPSGLSSPKELRAKDERMSMGFLNRIGLPKFSPPLNPFLQGQDLGENLAKKLQNLFIEEMIHHLTEENAIFVLNSRRMRSHFFLVIQTKLIESYPFMKKEKSSTTKGRRGPLGDLMNKVVNRMYSRHRRGLLKREKLPRAGVTSSKSSASKSKSSLEENGIDEEVDKEEDIANEDADSRSGDEPRSDDEITENDDAKEGKSEEHNIGVEGESEENNSGVEVGDTEKSDDVQAAVETVSGNNEEDIDEKA